MIEVFWVFLKLGLTSFGGPIAHLGYFHDEFVKRRQWLDEKAYADLVALCQFLPGPASSQVGIAIGLSRAGVLGAFAAWTGFTLPSALLLVTFGMGVAHFHEYIAGGWLHGLKLVAVPIVGQALWGMGNKLCYDKVRATIAILTAALVLLFPSAFAQIAAIILAGLIGWRLLPDPNSLPHTPVAVRLSRTSGAIALAAFALLLVLLPLAAGSLEIHALKLFDSFFRAGALVFGGGHVVLPLLKSEVVNPGWVNANSFMAGYGAAQAIPGPLFTFSAYLGAVSTVPPSGWAGACLCLTAAFLPSFLLVFGALPFWERLRNLRGMRAAMQGINASVVGLLLAALYNPVWTSAVTSAADFAAALVIFLLLMFWRTPSWAAVLLAAGAGGLIPLI